MANQDHARPVRVFAGAAGLSSLATLICALLTMGALGWPGPAGAIPAFAQQTGQRCEKCHVGAFGPQLTPYGRDFKLFGYVSADGKNKLPTIAFIAIGSLTHTQSDQSPPPEHFSTNDNAVVDEASLLYGGRLFAGAGAFAEVTYSGVERTVGIDNTDIKRTFDVGMGTRDLQLGVDLNNRPTVQDLWNSTPTWGFPYNSSDLAPTPAASPILDDALAQRVVGLGGYAMWDNRLYTELTLYQPVQNRLLGRLGVDSPEGTDVYDGVAPYWRVALQHDFGDQYLEVGALGLSARRFPGGDRSAGTDRLTDTAIDATYQRTGDARHFISAHAIWIHEDERLGASQILSGTRRSDHLDTVRADVSYSLDSTWTPSAQVFHSTGSNDPVFFGTESGRPNSDGYVAELAFVPWGKAASPVGWANARFTVQYVGYTKFDGQRHGASANNTVYMSARFAVAPLAAFRAP
jgi:hypothetical protein